jgi:hypothetical protein
MDFIVNNHEFILGLATTLADWVIAKITGKSLDKTKLNAALVIILDVIQDIKAVAITVIMMATPMLNPQL